MPYFAVVARKDAERVRKQLMDEGKINGGCKIIDKGNFVYIPVKEPINGYKCVEVNNCDRVRRPRKGGYRNHPLIPASLRNKLPRSYDIIGDIAVIKIGEEFAEHFSAIGKAIVETNKNVKVVLRDKGVKGVYRLRELEHMYGECRYSTIHKEYGVILHVDLRAAYFSPRLAGEHYRIAKLVGDGEIVLDMFAGVGPFSIMIAKYSNAGVVYANDINSGAYELVKKNVEANRVKNVIPLNMDAKEVFKVLEELPNRVIMNNPHNSLSFLPIVAKNVASCVVHLYAIVENDALNKFCDEVRGVIENCGRSIEAINLIKLHPYSPNSRLVCYDFQIL